MKIEHHLALREIAYFFDMGHSKETAIKQAAKLVKSQGFGAEYSKQVAKEMAELYC